MQTITGSFSPYFTIGLWRRLLYPKLISFGSEPLLPQRSVTITKLQGEQSLNMGSIFQMPLKLDTNTQRQIKSEEKSIFPVQSPAQKGEIYILSSLIQPFESLSWITHKKQVLYSTSLCQPAQDYNCPVETQVLEADLGFFTLGGQESI